MTMHDNGVDDYVQASTLWPEVIRALRPILLGAGLNETVKWNKPCYTHDGANIAIVQEMKAFLALMFFKGALLDDPDGVLQEQGPNSRSARRMTFTSVGDVHRLESSIIGLVQQAVAVERAGLAAPTPPPLELVAELRERLDADPHLAAAFDRLTPGRQRQYHLHIAGARQSTTRRSRVDTCIPRILAGKGLRDR
jgi:uncharacterized protein YdeI (YjbR/CyaY-like superfamily)